MTLSERSPVVQMTDTEILDWLEKHYTEFREIGVSDERRFKLSLIGARRDFSVEGPSLRTCVLKVLGRLQKEPV